MFQHEYILGLGRLSHFDVVKNAIKEDLFHFWLVPLLLECLNLSSLENLLVSVLVFALAHGVKKDWSNYFRERDFWIHKFPYVFGLGIFMWILAQYTSIVLECIFHIFWNLCWISKLQERQNLGTWLYHMSELSKLKPPKKETPEEQERSRQFWADLDKGVTKLFPILKKEEPVANSNSECPSVN